MKIKELNFKKMSVKNIRELFNLHYIGKDYLKEICNDEKLSNIQIKNKLIKEDKNIINILNSKKVKSIQCYTEWKKSYTWGSNPHMIATIVYKDNTTEIRKYTCGGCSYDKYSTVIAYLFNDVLKYKLYEMNNRKLKNKPYGIYIGKYDKYFGGGIGINSYNDIVKFIGGKMNQTYIDSKIDIIDIEFK